jgi:hypothetical protein
MGLRRARSHQNSGIRHFPSPGMRSQLSKVITTRLTRVANVKNAELPSHSGNRPVVFPTGARGFTVLSLPVEQQHRNSFDLLVFYGAAPATRCATSVRNSVKRNVADEMRCHRRYNSDPERRLKSNSLYFQHIVRILQLPFRC